MGLCRQHGSGRHADASIWSRKPGGYLTFGTDGRFFWLITRPGRAKFASGRRDQGTPDENRATVQGSLAYCGTYAVGNDTLIMRIEASTYPNEEGAEQKRAFTLNGDQLTWEIDHVDRRVRRRHIATRALNIVVYLRAPTKR